MTVRLNGKEYVTVSERVEAALSAETSYQMVSAETFSLMERWFYRVTLLVGERRYIGTAEIKFNASASSADGKNPIECAETSAVGRALGFAGFGVMDGIASADELMRSEPRPQRQAQPAPQPAPQTQRRAPQEPAKQTAPETNPPASEAQHRAIRKLCDALARDYPGDDMTAAEAGIIIGELGAEYQKAQKARRAS